MALPRIAITLGDPAGIGPEIVVSAWSDPTVHQCCRPLVVGHPDILRRALELLKCGARVVEIGDPGEAQGAVDVIPCLRAGSDDVLNIMPGTIDARGGQAAYDALLVAARAALDAQIDALVTAPLHKAALWKAGHAYPGHTELLAELCGVDDFAMMLYIGPGAEVRGPAGLAVAHVTLHMALAEALAALNEDSIVRTARLVWRVMSEIKGSPPRVGVAALNPHAGEEGLFGAQERTIIRPAVERGQAEGMDLVGPLPADTLLAQARDGQFDAVVAMYHDQGHI
ncbi:MAG: 4-hydroxythreonine-4-phosphate dehydrogenase PdxA, partial [Pirellulales bacterium]